MSKPIINTESTPIINIESISIINPESIDNNPRCCKKYYPRVPYTHINYLIDDCTNSPFRGDSDLPPLNGIYHPADPLIFCGLCTLVLDTLCCIPMYLILTR